MNTDKKSLLDNFNRAYANLNSEQKLAVDSVEGPVMVIAGPGTGKTQILTLRIANILKETDTRPENILALTFTDSGVRAMRNRLISFVGKDAYLVPIHTFHSFAGDLIRRYPDAYKNIIGGKPASDLEKIRIIEELLEEGSFKRLRPHGNHSYYVKPILGAITTMKRENISPTKLATANESMVNNLDQIEKFHTKGAHKGKVRGEYLDIQKSLEKNQELLYLYQHYIVKMRAERLFDFEDMILDTIEALQTNEEMLFDVQERYQYILADEHQDVNQSQNLLIKIIASYHDNPNVFVVGDEKQAIYRFQGASLENFLFFEDIYKSAKTIALNNNYRSGQEILDLAHESIKTDDPKLKDLRLPLVANKKVEVILGKQVFSHKAVEDAWLVQQIKKYHDEGVSWSEMAIIVRTNKEVSGLATLLRKANIPVLPSADSDILEHPIFLHIKTLINALVEKTDEVALAEVLQAPYWNLEINDLIKVFLARSYQDHLSSIIASEEKLKNSGVENPKAFLRISQVFNEARAKELTHSPAQVLEFLLTQSGFLDSVLQQSVYDGIRVVRRLYDEIESMFEKKEVSTLRDVLRQLELLTQYKIALNAPFIETKSNAVNLLTAHKAKGLEFEVVFLPHLCDKNWQGTSTSEKFNLPITKQVLDKESAKLQAEDDERRLFYVALTRAKRVIECSYALKDEEGKELGSAIFFMEIEHLFKENNEIIKFEEDFAPLNDLMPLPKPKIDAEFLRITLAKRGWSATTYSNYCKSPWEYICKNVLRIPTIKSPELQFGTTIHAVLEKIVDLYLAQGAVSDSEVKKLLEQELNKCSLTTTEFTRQHERGFSALMSYLPKLINSLGKSSKTEYSIKAILETGLVDFPEVMITGNFDRLDFDEEGRVIRVIDYKTGKSKTRGVIEGKTKDSDGRYKRQLVFYALLLSEQKDPLLYSANGRISFVEPDEKGVIREEDFTVTEEEIAELRRDIIEATKAVVSGACLEVSCDKEECEHCDFVELLQK